jgi:hypothetical protein
MRPVTRAMLESMPDPSDLHLERHGGRCWVMVGSAVLAEYDESDAVIGLLRVFRTAELVLFHAASCWFR